MESELLSALESLQGIARRAELLERAVPRGDLDRAVGAGELIRVRHGVYASPRLPTPALRAARVGGVLAGPSAAALLGLWEPPSRVLFVSVRPNARSLRDPDSHGRALSRRRVDIRVIHDGDDLDPSERSVVGVRRCVLQSIRYCAPPIASAILDSAIRMHSWSSSEIESLEADLPQRCALVVRRASVLSESGTESAMRWGLAEARIPFEAQKWLSPSIRVDFLVAGYLVVECVSLAFHSSREQYSADRERISEVIRLGYVVIELTYFQVFFSWSTTLATILAALSRG